MYVILCELKIYVIYFFYLHFDECIVFIFIDFKSINILIYFVTVLNAGKRFVCSNDCGKSYKYKHHLKRHILYECGGKKLFSCYICNKQFSRSMYLTTHFGLVHHIIP